MNKVYWLEQTAADVPEHNAWLGVSEIVYLGCLRVPKRSAEWRLGRWTAKQAVAACLNLPTSHAELAMIEIRPAASGAPEAFVAGRPAGVTISLGHRAGVAVCAVAGPNAVLGCDLEIVEPRSETFVSDYFTAPERELVEAAAADRDRVVALLWSAKESALKALQEGLRLDTRSVIAKPEKVLGQSTDSGQWLPLQVEYSGGQVFHGWWQATDGFLRTMVAATAPPRPVALKVAVSRHSKAA